jgi:hydrogenase expression/formation protein HypD
MRHLDEYRTRPAAEKLLACIEARATRPWTIMEVCGGQTHTLVKSGIDRMLPPAITLVHGPGCPVCVTPIETIDRAIHIASRPEVILTSFGDMLRVPGSRGDLLSARAEGGDVRIVYSPLDAVKLAARHPDRQVVFLAVGFETTAPANAMAIWHTHALGLTNFSMLVAHVLVPPAMEAILAGASNRVQGFLGAGHVCAIMGYREYEPLARRYGTPIVVTGFEPVDLLQGILTLVEMLEDGRQGVANAYARAVCRTGNLPAQEMIRRVFEVTEREWRGLGTIPNSGLALRPGFRAYDAARRFAMSDVAAAEPGDCLAGQVLQGILRPDRCPEFGVRCTPERPLGAPMVSSEGACAAYHHYGRTPAVRR